MAVRTILIGIAAPQIAENYLVFVTHARNTKSRNFGREDIFRVFINPKITFFSKGKHIIWEGCGSVCHGQLFAPVLRSKEITVEAFNDKGNKFSLVCDGILARVIQHEYDHISGIEFLEKIDDYRKRMSREYYRKSVKDSPAQIKASKITKLVFKKLLFANG